ncbi:DUF6090 family protein [Robiginitalea sp. SC105]|uniref:DUF6090 family protein n=1 Tax=Robiginitalea sp. SC105 TaxID=2762332 RepID=UPI00163AAFF4|nr:DUF6090 family protein [Robiginitalea sp. SC105]MBC2838960.1 hypothetical protein [Robiginitalea sp. SC105]
MVRLWHKLRYRLIEDQKVKRYLLYALGEILLIVIGILIAFQVNNWDILKKQERQSLELVRNLRSDLVRDTANLKEVIEMYTEIYQDRLKALGTRDFGDMPGDSIMDLVTPKYRTVDFVSPTFHKMESIGLTELAGFGDLFDRVNDYYTTIQNNYRNFIDWDSKSALNEAQFWYYNPDFENYYHEIFVGDSLPALQSETARKSELVRLLKTPRVRNMLRTSAMRKKETIDRIRGAREYAINLLGAIDSTLAER